MDRLGSRFADPLGRLQAESSGLVIFDASGISHINPRLRNQLTLTHPFETVVAAELYSTPNNTVQLTVSALNNLYPAPSVVLDGVQQHCLPRLQQAFEIWLPIVKICGPLAVHFPLHPLAHDFPVPELPEMFIAGEELAQELQQALALV